MSTNVAAQTEQQNPFQRYLIPQESRWVRFVMHQAGEFSRSDNPVTARALSVACAVAGVVLSLFNTISYLLQAPIRVLLNAVTFSPVSLAVNLIQDLKNTTLSFAFVSLGVTFITAGLLFPEPIFTNFAPEEEETLSSVLAKKEKDLEKKDENIERLEKIVEILHKRIIELEAAAHPRRRGWLSWRG